jgi:hypothetical protein
MKKILLILILLFLTGCQSKTESVDNEMTLAGTSGDIIDSYEVENYDSQYTLFAFSVGGQVFNASSGYRLDRVSFYLKKNAISSCDITAKLYEATGTYGVDTHATGTVLSTSDIVNASTFKTSFSFITFNFPNKYQLTAGNKYVVLINGCSTAIGNPIYMARDGSSPTHAGNYSGFTGWDSAYDAIFYVYGIPPIYSGAGDGFITNNDTTWAAARSAASGDVSYYTQDYTITRSFLNAISEKPTIDRTFLPFDTSAIPANASITSATLYVYMPSTPVCDEFTPSFFIGVVETSQASSTILSNADFDAVGSVVAATSTYAYAEAVYASSTYMSFSLNTTGLGWIKKSGETSSCGTNPGTTCLGLREGHDFENIDIGINSCAQIIATSVGDAGEEPYLVITYTFPDPNDSFKIKDGTVQIKSGVLQIKD